VEYFSIAGDAFAPQNGRMYTLHIGNKNYSSWSLRPWALMSELGIAFEEVNHVFGADFARTIDGKSPSHKVPVLHDDARIVWDSLAIAEYLADRHANVWPTDAGARAWARCAAAEMHSSFQALRNTCGMNCGVRVKLHGQSEALKKDIARVGELWIEGLARFGGPFLAGAKFGAVDAFFCPVAYRIQSYGLELPPEAAAYAKRLLALASMQRWYEAALAEPYRDAEHEVEIAAAGTVTQDLRKPKKATTPA
jgi:glutathione S-transferase